MHAVVELFALCLPFGACALTSSRSGSDAFLRITAENKVSFPILQFSHIYPTFVCSPSKFCNLHHLCARDRLSFLAKICGTICAEVPLRQSALPQPVLQSIPFQIGPTAFGLLEAGHGRKRDGETDETSNKRQKMAGKS